MSSYQTYGGSLMTSAGTSATLSATRALQPPQGFEYLTHNYNGPLYTTYDTVNYPYPGMPFTRGHEYNLPTENPFDTMDYVCSGALIAPGIYLCNSHSPLDHVSGQSPINYSNLSRQMISTSTSSVLRPDFSMPTTQIRLPSSTGHPLPSEAISGDPELTTEEKQLILRLLPGDSVDHARKRERLCSILKSLWKKTNAFEHKNSNVLLHFVDKDTKKDKWVCSFYKDTRRCDASYHKRDQAISHIRAHIKHCPYACKDQGDCPINGQNCNKRYPSIESLQKHRTPPVPCSRCHRPMLKGNLKRHMAGPCRGQTSSYSSPSFASSPE